MIHIGFALNAGANCGSRADAKICFQCSGMDCADLLPDPTLEPRKASAGRGRVGAIAPPNAEVFPNGQVAALSAWAGAIEMLFRLAKRSMTLRISASVCRAERKKRSRGWSFGTPIWIIGGT